MIARTLTLVAAAAAVLMTACSALIDTTPPDVSLSVRANDIVKTGDTITINALDAQSGIASIAVDFDGASLLLRTIPEDDRTKEAVSVEVTIERDLVLGELYTLDAVVVNGVGISTEVSLQLLAGAADDVAAPVLSGPVVQWTAPAPGSSVPGVVTLEGRATAEAGLETVTFSIENASGAVTVPAVDAGDDTFTYAWNTVGWPAGDYVITFSARDAEGLSRDVKVRLVLDGAPDGAPSLAFVAPSPTPGQRVAGFVNFAVEFDAPRGFESAEVTLVGADGGNNRLAVDVDEAAGTIEGRFVTLDLESGDYVLTATVTDVSGATQTVELPFTVLTPFVITSPTDDENIGPSSPDSPSGRQLVAIVVGTNGTINNDVTVSGAAVYLNGFFLGNAVIEVAADNRVAVYTWDTAVSVVGVHDAAASGDRVVTVLVTYSYLDDTGATVSSTRFTPGVLLDFHP